MLEHGGHLLDAAKQYHLPPAQWIDLSTGINPNGWPVPDIPGECWQRLPETADQLNESAKQYYQCQSLLAVAGSQAAIQTLPLLRQKSKVGVFSPAYAEHRYSWQKAGHEIIELNQQNLTSHLPSLDVLIIINPNNPTGERFTQDQLLAWHRQLKTKGGWLIVDEAFIDSTPEYSLSTYPVCEGLIILRSVGKFFGLAGIRCGFVIAAPNILDRLNEKLGPWTISHPSRYVASRALTDTVWQQKTRQQLKLESGRLHSMLTQHNLKPDGQTDLFVWIKTPQAEQLHTFFAQAGILTRLFYKPSSLRFGLPTNSQQWLRIEKRLHETIANNLNQA